MEVFRTHYEAILTGSVGTLERFAIAGIILVVFLVFKNLMTKTVFRVAQHYTSKTTTEIDDNILEAFRRPMQIFWGFLGIYLSLRYLNISSSFNATLLRFFKASLVIMVAWGFYNLEGTYSIVYEKMGQKFNFRANRILKPFLTRALRIITVVMTVGIVAEIFNYPISSFVAGLGLGGLAVAMAAKDTLANIFGGVVILMDNPFDIDDWIKTGHVEGVVEDINFRSCRIRTFDKAIVTVPNAHLTDQPITNYSRRGIRRVTFNLGLTYDTSVEKMKTVVEQIEAMLKKHQKVDQETLFVKFDTFNESSLDIFLYFFTETADWAEYLSIKQDINFKIMEILEEQGASVAFPSTSLYFENTLKTHREKGAQ